MVECKVLLSSEKLNLQCVVFMPSIRIPGDTRVEGGLTLLLLKLAAVEHDDIPQPHIPGLLKGIVGDFPMNAAAIVTGRKKFGGKVLLQTPICKGTSSAGNTVRPDANLTEMRCILWVSGVTLHPDMLSGRELFVLLPEQTLFIPDQELIEDIEVVGTIGSHCMGEELINNLVPDHEVM